MTSTAIQIAVVGAGPAGLALALHAARLLPHASITLYDRRPAERDVAGDARTLALALGSVQFLERLGCWPEAAARAIESIHVSQRPPSPGDAEVVLRAADLGQPRLGAVLGYGALVAPLQRAWEAACALHPGRLRSRWGTAVTELKPLADGVEVDAGIAERYDLAVVAEGGVFSDQARKSLRSDYGQTAWVGSVEIEGGTPGMAFERFTRHGPAALLPLPLLPALPAGGARARMALVWCVPTGDDPVRELDDDQRLAVLNTMFPPAAGRLVALSALKSFALGLNVERTLVDGRVVRIGNAAQTLHPVAGQGLNLGLRDVAELVAVLRWSDDIDRALRRAEWARAGDRWLTIATTDFLARSFTWKLPGAATARGLGLAALGVMPWAQRALARQMMFGRR
ncbi:MAG: FAD-dependent monooxygenase [Burkholderiales bacterium]|nr:FAD-dependent monooxygenase [Burkholderiales bacterium]MDE1928074.1 FAD-dependent monooxygenase [Burkholderiales bacterium]MDE2158530.1 FAD-dependent monooxygenase [Burkholderiales bacterium]MDE2504694.1 FAD-dependent monooxygenase [Burkholderiales bacterium]